MRAFDSVVLENEALPARCVHMGFEIDVVSGGPFLRLAPIPMMSVTPAPAAMAHPVTHPASDPVALQMIEGAKGVIRR